MTNPQASPWWSAGALDVAWQAALRDAKSEDIPDVLQFEDAKVSWQERKSAIIASLESGRIEPEVPELVEVPKDQFVTRPIARLTIRDRVIYELMATPLRQLAENVLDRRVFSSRYDRNGRRRKRGVAEWAQFQAAGRELYKKYDSAFMISTDVSSYFEYVEVSILVQDLRALGADTELVNCLSSFLNSLARISPVWGLPQGPEGSSTLGNLYLQPVDAYLVGQPHFG